MVWVLRCAGFQSIGERERESCDCASREKFQNRGGGRRRNQRKKIETGEKKEVREKKKEEWWRSGSARLQSWKPFPVCKKIFAYKIICKT